MRSVRSFTVVGIAWALSLASPAQAKPPQTECVDAYTEGQEFEQRGSLLRARARFLVCARDPCSKVLTKDCIQWVDDVERKIPTVVLEVHAATGEEVSSYALEIDGAQQTSKIDGRAIELDPGKHTIRVVGPDKVSVVQDVVAREGEKGRKVVLTLASPRLASPRVVAVPPGPPAPAGPPAAGGGEPHARPPWSVYPLAAVAAVSLASFGYFGIRGLSDRSDLDSCKGACSGDAVSHARSELLVADISLGVAAVSVGVATVLWLTAKH